MLHNLHLILTCSDFPSGLSTINTSPFLVSPFLLYTLYHPPWIDHLTLAWQMIQATKHVIMLFPHATGYYKCACHFKPSTGISLHDHAVFLLLL
jgi:hypothetical protein